MLLSRFWYVVLALLLAGAVFSLYLAQSMFNRAGAKVVAEGLYSDSQVVAWYMRNVARERSAQLIKFALQPDVAKALRDASKSTDKIPSKAKDAATSAIKKLADAVPDEFKFDAVFAVDRHGRVVGQFGYEQSTENPDFELGGYPVVADALHGYIRDDTFVWERLYTVVARPVEVSTGELPVGAVVGLRTIDERFAREISERTGAAVAFYRDGLREAAGVPDNFTKADLDGIVNDLSQLPEDKDYNEKGRSNVRYITPTVGAVYARLPGQAWARGAGYVVGRKAFELPHPLAFFGAADDKDKEQANLFVIVLVALLSIALGIGFSMLEHTRPLIRFRQLAEELAEGKVDQLAASKVNGVYRKIATLINDGIDHAVAKGGGSRRVADLQSVLGDIPEQPAMSAFAFPSDESPVSSSPVPSPAPSSPQSAPQAGARPLPRPPGQKRNQGLAQTMPEGGLSLALAEPDDEKATWRQVYEEFVATKQKCGESTSGLSYEKFEGTLKKNKAAIQQRHKVDRVKFTVYVKEGKAALKASPIRA
jgi:hypothetical protein